MPISLVTGGAGFIGSHIVDMLVARGDKVRVLDNLATGHHHNLQQVADKIEFIEGDIRNEAVVQKAVKDVEFIFHLAALVSVPQSMQQPVEAELINAVGTLNVLNAAKASGVRRLVLSSTCAVYGDEPTLPKIETMQPRPKSPYAVSKQTAEYYCQLYHDLMGLETVILRYFNIYGPRQDPSSVYSGVISIFVDKMMQNSAPFIYGDGQQTRDFVFVKDVARANLMAAEEVTAAGQVFNIGTGRQITINHLFNTLRAIFNNNLEPVYKEARAGDILHSYADATQAQKVLSWSAQVSFEEGLKQLVGSVTAAN